MNIRDLKVGEVVELLALKEGGIATSNSAGGTEYLPRGTRMVVTVTKRWDDYETGIHYWGQPERGKKVFFGEFDVKATPVGGEPADVADMGKLEVGDKVEIEATRQWGISTDNAQGGTVPFPAGRKVVVTVTKKWDDHETGINYWGKPERGGKTLYFGEFWTKGRRVAGMNKVMVARELLAAARDMVGGDKHDKWDEILELLKKTKRYGEEEMVDFISQTWNGGVEQWVYNGYSKGMHAVVGVARKLGPAGRDMAGRLEKLKGAIEELEESQTKRDQWGNLSEEEWDTAELEKFDDWFYAGADEKVVAELLEYMKA